MSSIRKTSSYRPYEISRAFRPEELAGHYVLAAEPDLLPNSWPRFQLGGRLLACEPRLPCFAVVDSHGEQIGFLLGFPIDETGELLVDTARAVVVPHGYDIESWLYKWAGRWLAIFITPGFERVYMDPAGSLCAVYSQSTGVVATSPGLIPYTDQTRDRTDATAQMPLLDKVSMYPIGMTPRYGVDRLVPNHYLDLSTWRSHRHWPLNPIATNADVETTTCEIMALTRRNIAAVAARYPLQLSLTAGWDSRAILAAARPYLGQTTLFTTAQPTPTAELDVYIAKRIARAHRLNHRIIPHEPPSEADTNLWLYRTGCSIGNPGTVDSSRLIRQLDPSRAYLSGHLGGVSKNKFEDILPILQPGWDGRTITPEHLIALSLAPRTEEAMVHMTNWLEGVVLDATDQILNLFFLEQRVGCWIAVNTSAFADTYRFELWPLNSRRQIELMFSLPLEFKRAKGMHSALISQGWPELMDYSVNEAPLLFRVRRKANRLLRKLKK